MNSGGSSRPAVAWKPRSSFDRFLAEIVAIHSTFITPPTNNSAINAHQQPTQCAPTSTSSSSASTAAAPGMPLSGPLGIAAGHAPLTYKMLISPEAGA
jgi:hypothetical protein